MSPRWKHRSRVLILTVALTSFMGLVSVPFLPASITTGKGSRSLTSLKFKPSASWSKAHLCLLSTPKADPVRNA